MNKYDIIYKRIAAGVKDILFPPACPICSNPRPVIDNRKMNICPWCLKYITYIKEPACLKCGKALEDDNREYCKDCTDKQHLFNQAVSMYEYSEGIKQSIYNFKYHNKREYAEVYADEISGRYGDVINMWQPDVIMPVPIHVSKLKSRGYNQAGLIAESLSKKLDIEYNEHSLIRTRATSPMKDLNDIQRTKNLQKAFKIADNVIIYNKVLIVDDIYTTGTTIDACAECLKRAGVKEVYAVTLCVGRGF